MRPERTKLDWILEGVSLAALLAGIALFAAYWDQIPRGFPRRFGFAPPPTLWSARNALWVVIALNTLAYLGLTAAAHWQKLIHIPDELDRESPHLRPMLFSMVIVLKAVLTLFSLYLVWALVNIAQGAGGGLSRGFLTLFVLLVPVPLVLYTVKLRRYRR